MGCRSFLQGWRDANGQDVTSGRMNLGVVTVNLPRIAMESNGDMDKFWEIFNERMSIARDAWFIVWNVSKRLSQQMRPFFTSMEHLENV